MDSILRTNQWWVSFLLMVTATSKNLANFLVSDTHAFETVWAWYWDHHILKIVYVLSEISKQPNILEFGMMYKDKHIIIIPCFSPVTQNTVAQTIHPPMDAIHKMHSLAGEDVVWGITYTKCCLEETWSNPLTHSLSSPLCICNSSTRPVTATYSQLPIDWVLNNNRLCAKIKQHVRLDAQNVPRIPFRHLEYPAVFALVKLMAITVITK